MALYIGVLGQEIIFWGIIKIDKAFSQEKYKMASKMAAKMLYIAYLCK